MGSKDFQDKVQSPLTGFAFNGATSQFIQSPANSLQIYFTTRRLLPQVSDVGVWVPPEPAVSVERDVHVVHVVSDADM